MSKVEFRPNEGHLCGFPLTNDICGDEANYRINVGCLTYLWRCRKHAEGYIVTGSGIDMTHYKEEKMEFKVGVCEAVSHEKCCQGLCVIDAVYAFELCGTERSSETYIWLCEEHGKHLKALVESQDEEQEGTLLKDLPDGTVLKMYRNGTETCSWCGYRGLLVVKGSVFKSDISYIASRCRECGKDVFAIREQSMGYLHVEPDTCSLCYKPYTLLQSGKKYPQVPEDKIELPRGVNSFIVEACSSAGSFCEAYECKNKNIPATALVRGYFGCETKEFGTLLCDRHGVSPVEKQVEYCQECGNVKEG